MTPFPIGDYWYLIIDGKKYQFTTYEEAWEYYEST
jgi:hypothetical protein